MKISLELGVQPKDGREIADDQVPVRQHRVPVSSWAVLRFVNGLSPVASQVPARRFGAANLMKDHPRRDGDLRTWEEIGGGSEEPQ